MVEIDTRTANIETIYQDPNYISGYYFLGNINKESIKVVDKEK